MSDLGLTHVALAVRNTVTSAAFYAKYADLEVVHRRPSKNHESDVLWLSDHTRPFVVVLIPTHKVGYRLGGMNHLGVACASREEVDRRIARARAEGRTVRGPEDAGPPVGYWGLIEDPDGHTLELSHGQDVGLAVEG